MQHNEQPSTEKRIRLRGPLAVGLLFGLLAVVLSLVGLAHEHNLSLRNIALAVVLGGGTWGLISWAIATSVAQVEEDTAERDNNSPDDGQGTSPRSEDHKEEKG